MINFFRSLRSHKWTSFVAIFGFATGLAAATLLLIFIQHELSYDRHWPNGDRIFRMNVTIAENNNRVEFPICLRKAFTELPSQVPGIEAAVQIYRTINPEIKINDQRFRNLRFLYVDSTFFQVFRMQPKSGDLRQALKAPDAIVINQRTANLLFGGADPIGQMITVSENSLPEPQQLFRIAVVVPDLSKTSHFDFDVLLPMAANHYLERMGGLEFYTYYVLRKDAGIQATLTDIERAHSAVMQEWSENLGLSSPPGTRLLPLKEIYLSSEAHGEIGPTGDPKTIQIFSILTGLILVIAIANFVNLFLVQSQKRTLGIGIRKTLGATRLQLIWQFLNESFWLFGISLGIALYAVSWLVGPFGNLVRRPLSIGALMQPEFLFAITGLFLLIALLAGAYPALYLSKQQPISVLKGVGSTGLPKQRLRKGIVLAQFAICMLLLTNLFVLQKQFDFMNSMPLGFDAKNVVAYSAASLQLQSAYPLIKQDLLQYPDVISVTGSHSRPGQGASGQSIKRFGMPDQERISIREVRVQPDFLETYGMQLQAGRSFRADHRADRNAVVLNEAAVRALDLSEPVGAAVVMFRESMEVIGVVKDYHYSSLRDPIQPEVFTYYKDQIFTISIRLNTSDPQTTIGRINQLLVKYDSDYAPDYVFLQDAFAAMYGGEHRLIQLVKAGSILALILSLLGLASITAITVRQRTKEIGIRKVVGANDGEIVRLLIGAQMRTMFITIGLAGLLASWIIQKWLENYAYRINVSFGLFLMAGMAILIIALPVTIVISYRAARANPVEALRYE